MFKHKIYKSFNNQLNPNKIFHTEFDSTGSISNFD